MKEYVVVFDKVVKKFRKYVLKRQYTTLKTEFVNYILRRRGRREREYVTALDGVSFKVEKGETLGIIGKNGSGKTTVLKLIARIYRPTAGTIKVKGRVAALIELGAGFHPDFSGRENVYINGIILGLKREEIDAKFDEIVKFAELEEFIDMPVRTYSSGMYMRLAFSVATHVDPDILLIDEVLAVGDEGFVRKCNRKMEEFKKNGKTMIIVSHNLEAIRKLCDRVMWLEDGRIKKMGEPEKVIEEYKLSFESSQG